MTDLRTDDEQLEALKSWWKENGQQILVTALVVATGYFGWTFWTNAKNEKIYAANDLYMQLAQASEQAESGAVALEEELQTVRFLADQLQNGYASSQYATLGALLAARTEVASDNLTEAQSRLEWALDNADTEAEAQLISYRLAKIRLALDDADGALALLQGESEEYATLYADLRGDALLAQGNRDAALAAYQVASENLLPGQQHYLSTLQLKIANLSSGLGSL